MKPVVAALRALVQEVAAALGPAKKREAEDNSRRIGVLFWRINAGEVSPGVQAQLQQLAAALSAGDVATAQSIQVRASAHFGICYPFFGLMSSSSYSWIVLEIFQHFCHGCK